MMGALDEFQVLERDRHDHAALYNFFSLRGRDFYLNGAPESTGAVIWRTQMLQKQIDTRSLLVRPEVTPISHGNP